MRQSWRHLTVCGRRSSPSAYRDTPPRLEEKYLAPSGGRIVQAKGRCATHRPLFGNYQLFGY
jgi:hypothetical protein